MAYLTVTILVCTRDRPQQLSRCLESLFTLDYKPLEIIVVDNGSRSFSAPALNYPFRTRFFSQPVPGLSFARNSVLPLAEGEIIALLDDDATAGPQWLKKAAPHFEDPQVAGVTGKVLPLEPANEWQMKQWSERWAGIPDHPAVFDPDHFDPLNSLVGTGTNLLVRRQFLQKHPFCEMFGPGTPVGAGDEDELFYRMIRSGQRIHYEPEAITYHEYVSRKEDYEKQRIRYGASRGALLTHFLFFENGMRFSTLRHLLRKLPASKERTGGAASRARGLLRGPLALWRSRRFIRRHYAVREACRLLDAFPGRDDHVIVKPQI